MLKSVIKYLGGFIYEKVGSHSAKRANGFYLDGTVWLNKDSKMQVERILGHELTHYGESADFINNILDSSLFYDFINKNFYDNNVASVTHAIVAVCLFLMLYEITPAKILMTAAEKISICSFEMYLISYMTDYFCHTYLSIPLLFVFATDFTMAFIGANLIRSILVPAGKVIRKKICK